MVDCVSGQALVEPLEAAVGSMSAVLGDLSWVPTALGGYLPG